jgi:hypothetical protein
MQTHQHSRSPGHATEYPEAQRSRLADRLQESLTCSPNCGRLAPCVVVPDNPVDDFSHRDVFSLRLCLNPLDKRFFDVQRPALGRSRGFVRFSEEVFSLAPPGKNLLKISEIRERDVNVDICSSTCVDLGGATIVYMRGLRRKCPFY